MLSNRSRSVAFSLLLLAALAPGRTIASEVRPLPPPHFDAGSARSSGPLSSKTSSIPMLAQAGDRPTAGSTSAKTAANALPGKLLPGGWRELGWDDLMPPDWDPLKLLEGRGVEALSDGDPRAEALMRELREQWDRAPTRAELDGIKIRLPGYVVPLDMLGGDIREFLLVPYLGACIHTPPPPANQIIHAVAARKHALQTMDAIWINGTLRVARSDTNMGVSGYRLDVSSIEPYRAPKR